MIGSDNNTPDADEMKDLILLPHELQERLKFFCMENGFATGMVAMKDITVFFIADSELGPNECAILGAHMLISGVVNGNLQMANEATIQAKQSEPSPQKH